jgi:hypothetical protein
MKDTRVIMPVGHIKAHDVILVFDDGVPEPA